MITVVLNGFKRQSHLAQQIDCVTNQSVGVERVMVWNNGPAFEASLTGGRAIVANSSMNLGVWSRFAFALNAETEFVCVLDDDTFPRERFFESCLKCMESREALYGARGLRFLSSKRYEPYKGYGWDCPNDFAEQVDIVGHAWFFRREWLSHFWRELPEKGASKLVGEDMHFSFMLQKYAGIPTMVPPHPRHSPEIWGSDPTLALKLGTGDAAISQANGSSKKFDKALRSCVQRGFKLLKDESAITDRAIVIGPGLSKFRRGKAFLMKLPWLEKKVRKFVRYLASKNIHI